MILNKGDIRQEVTIINFLQKKNIKAYTQGRIISIKLILMKIRHRSKSIISANKYINNIWLNSNLNDEVLNHNLIKQHQIFIRIIFQLTKIVKNLQYKLIKYKMPLIIIKVNLYPNREKIEQEHNASLTHFYNLLTQVKF